MLNRKQNDVPAFGKSPKVRRKIDYTEREYQPSVIDRARSTLFNLTDIWKSKIDANKVNNKACDSMSANRKALDVLTVWARHRRSPSADPTLFTKSHHNRNLFIENGTNEYWRNSIDSSSYVKTINGINKSKSNDVSDRKKYRYRQRTAKTNNIMSNELTVYTRRRSFDTRLNKLNFGEIDYISEMPTLRHRRRSWDRLTPEVFHEQCYVNKMYSDDREHKKEMDNQTCIVNARLKFKKIKTCDDLYVNEIAEKKPIKVLKRQTSVVPIITINDCDYEQSAIVDEKKLTTRQLMITNETTKPRKKLSFREPVIYDEKLKELREKHSGAKNHSNSQERDDEENSISNESLDINQVPLEVYQ